MERNLKTHANEFVTSPLVLLFFSNKKIQGNCKGAHFERETQGR